MKQKLAILIGLILLFVVLAGLNAASYTQKEKTPDTEAAPNRSTYNSGATGTQAFYSLLAETGRKVTRWQEPPAALLTARANKPAVFVVTGAVRRGFSDQDVEQLLRWVSEGGRLVLIDRTPPEGLVTTTGNWKISAAEDEHAELYVVDPTDQKQMIGDTAAIKPVQPTVLTHSINAVQPSKFASSIGFERLADEKPVSGYGTGLGTAPPPKAEIDPGASPALSGPVVHFATGDQNLVVEVPYGSGRIVYVTDPYIVANGGINLVDNAQLGVNLVATPDGIVAFDEYHQGYGEDNNRFLQFFAGTPVVAIFLQLGCSSAWSSFRKVAGSHAPCPNLSQIAFQNSNTSRRWPSFKTARERGTWRSRISIPSFAGVRSAPSGSTSPPRHANLRRASRSVPRSTPQTSNIHYSRAKRSSAVSQPIRARSCG
jgi:hypothetical protein